MKTYPNGIVGSFPNGYKGWGDAMNENLQFLAFFTNLCVENRTVGNIPKEPKEFETYILPANSGFSKPENTVVIYIEDSWRFYTPFDGLIAFIKSENAISVFLHGTWQHGIKVFRTQEEEKAHFAALLDEIRPEPTEPEEPEGP